MGVNTARLKLNYEFAKFDRYVCLQLTVLSLVGTVLLIYLGVVNNDPWGGGIFASMFLGLAFFTGYLAKRSNDAMKYWKQQCELYKTPFEDEHYA